MTTYYNSTMQPGDTIVYGYKADVTEQRAELAQHGLDLVHIGDFPGEGDLSPCSQYRIIRPTEAGWGWPVNARKPHYFEQGKATSICGRWMFSGERGMHNGVVRRNRDCAECIKRLTKAGLVTENLAS